MIDIISNNGNEACKKCRYYLPDEIITIEDIIIHIETMFYQNHMKNYESNLSREGIVKKKTKENYEYANFR